MQTQAILKAALCAAALFAAAPAASGTRVEGTRTAFEAPAVAALLPELEVWLDANSDYARAGTPLARIVFVEAGHEIPHDGQTTRLGSTVRGVYEDESATIYLVRPWFGDDPRDKSVLLHELVHHRQAAGPRHWYCPQAMEWDAYKLQEAWLAEHGLESGFHWAAILLDSSCSVRDHHPD